MRPERASIGIVLGLVLLNLAVFLQVRRFEFVNLDDGIYVVRNADLDAGLDREIAVRTFTTPFLANWAPLTLLSFHLDHALYGKRPAGYHVTNVALHTLATLLLFAALMRMTGRAAPSAFVAAVFAVHPLHVETVAWISERKGVLAGCFWMAGLLAHARYAERPSAGRYAQVLACLGLGLLSKPVLVTFPFALLLLDHWPLRRLSRRALLEKLPMLLLVAGACALTLWAQRAGGAMAFAERSAIPLEWRLANAMDACWQYLREAVWPVGLSAYHPHPLGTLAPGRTLAQAGLLAALSVFALRARRHPELGVGWLWFLGTLRPTLGLVQVGSMGRADRYTYIPLVGLGIALAFFADAQARQRPRAQRLVAALGAVAVAALAAAAWVQAGSWRSSESLYEQNLASEPGSAFGHGGLALVRVEQQRFEEAEHHFLEQQRLRPDLGRDPLRDFQILMGARAAGRGDEAEAIARYERALALDPASPVANGVLGAALVRAGQRVLARPYLARAVAAEGAPAVAYAALAVVLAADGQEALAVASGREALRKDPELGWAANNLAWILATSADPRLRDPAQAVRLAEGAVRRADPPDAEFLDTLATAYAAAGRPEDARRAAAAAAALGPPSRTQPGR